MAKREEILTTALEIVARDGYSKATVRELADAVGLSQAGLLHYFGTKEVLFTAILQRRDEVDVDRALGDPGEDSLVELVEHNAEVPGLVQLYSRFASEAAEKDHPSHEFFRERYRLSRAGLAAQVERMQASGELPSDLDAERIAIMMFAMIDGLQTHWMFDPELDMAQHVSYFWEVLRRAGK